jgi:hypothetical protein
MFPETTIPLLVEHIVTADDPFGEPWPPDGQFSIVRRAGGFTKWRRLRHAVASDEHSLKKSEAA